MKKITIILPIHKFDDLYLEMAENAIKSVETFYEDVKLLIVVPSQLFDENYKKLYSSQKLETNIIRNTSSDLGFCSQVNFGLKNCDTEWVSILEVDDEYKPIWLKSMMEHIINNPEVDVFLPIVKDINVKGEFLTFTNESCWAYGFSRDKQGFLDLETLLEYQNYQTSGALFKTKTLIDQGMFKDKIKLTFTYELLLRLTFNAIKIMVVPRIGYQHVNFREDSLFWNYRNDEKTKLTEKEVKFWLESAKKEYFFKNNRDLNYVEV